MKSILQNYSACGISMAAIAILGLVATSSAQPELRAPLKIYPIADGASVLTGGRMNLVYVIPAGSPPADTGALVILTERRYRDDFPQTHIPSSVQLSLGKGFASPRSESKTCPYTIYLKYHSADNPITNFMLQNWFHQRFGDGQRTDQPSNARRPLFLFHSDGKRHQRTAHLIQYKRPDSTVETIIPFWVGVDQAHSEAIITVADLGDGSDQTISTRWKLFPAQLP